ncbi:hypothetical protein PMG11_09191 [Penicillium brasilianum]|uniref:Uncharacterized protein n=1 Tax=Penicillium brasilianum TaxID=104259 RepID=A0A0F7U022_PENBI|nr:hypothetical protein PMG11_09191 [Penicillium brasilianum]
MVSLPEDDVKIGTNPLKTLRVLIPDTHPDIDEYIKAQGLSNAIRAAVPLEKTASRPDRQTLVDLAVVGKELSRVERCLCCITSPLSDLSMVFIPTGSISDETDHERRKWLRSVWVYNKYLNAQIKQSETAQLSVLEWYDMRFHEMNTTMFQTYKKEPLILDRAPSVP